MVTRIPKFRGAAGAQFLNISGWVRARGGPDIEVYIGGGGGFRGAYTLPTLCTCIVHFLVCVRCRPSLTSLIETPLFIVMLHFWVLEKSLLLILDKDTVLVKHFCHFSKEVFHQL
jgi:hypothetical protein